MIDSIGIAVLYGKLETINIFFLYLYNFFNVLLRIFFSKKSPLIIFNLFEKKFFWSLSIFIQFKSFSTAIIFFYSTFY